jgi:hypothetical protein
LISIVAVQLSWIKTHPQILELSLLFTFYESMTNPFPHISLDVLDAAAGLI